MLNAHDTCACAGGRPYRYRERRRRLRAHTSAADSSARATTRRAMLQSDNRPLAGRLPTPQKHVLLHATLCIALSHLKHSVRPRVMPTPPAVVENKRQHCARQDREADVPEGVQRNLRYGGDGGTAERVVSVN